MSVKSGRFKCIEKDSDVIWCKLLDGSEKHGLQFAFPKTHTEYGKDLEKIISDISEGDLFHAKLRSANKSDTKWIFVSIEMGWKNYERDERIA